MTEDEGMGCCGEGDCAVRILFDQDADGHCRRRETGKGDGAAGDSGMSDGQPGSARP